MTASIDRSTLLSLVPVNTLNSENIQELLGKVQAGELKKGQSLFKQGDNQKFHIYVIKGEVALSTDGNVVKNIEGGSPESKHPLAHSFPRPVTAKATSDCTLVKIDSDLLDIMLTWDQTGTYSVENIEDQDNGDDSDWMTKMLQTKAFHRIPPANIQTIFMRMEAVTFTAGETVIKQGEEGDYFYIIKDGQCKVSRATPGNPDGVVLAKLGVGDSFGEEALISSAKRNATITMTADGSMMRLSKEDFISLLNEPLMEWIDFEKAIEMTAKNGDVVWLDVRLPSEYENNHLKGSLNIPLIFLRMKVDTLDTSKKYIVHCDTGRRSSAASYLLKERGLDTYVLKDGLDTAPEDAMESGK